MPNLASKQNSRLVFVSHASEDKAKAIELKLVLESKGIAVFIDTDDIHGDHSFAERIDAGLRSCTHFIAILSNVSAVKPWVVHELKCIRSKVVGGKLAFFALCLEGYTAADFQQQFPTLSIVPIRLFNEETLKLMVDEILGISRKPTLGELPAAAQQTNDSGFSAGAFALAKWLCKKSERAMVWDPQIEINESVLSAIGMTTLELKDALCELETSALIYNSAGSRCWSIGTRPALFAAFDQFLMPWNPAQDAKTVAARLCATAPNGEVLGSQEVATELGWTPRRMNPAIQWLLQNRLIDARD